MISNIIKLTFRIIGRNKIYSGINLLGLIIGLSCSLLIFMWVWNEIKFDKFHEKLDHIYIMQQTMNLGDSEYTTDRCGALCAPALAENFPDITMAVRTGQPGEMLLAWNPELVREKDLSTEEKKFIEEQVLAVDSLFLELFTFKLLQGNPETVLDEPYSIVLSKEMAEKYFGQVDPMDQVIRINEEYEFKVTGIVEDVPDNSSIQFEFLIPFSFLKELGFFMDQYEGNPFGNSLYIENPDNYKMISSQLPEFFTGRYDSDVESVQKLLPFSRQHLFGETRTFWAVLLFSILSFLILIIACINFMNLSTARYIGRTIEVGIRKVSGATRWQLIKQFMGETLILVFIALNIALLLIDLYLSEFNRIFESNLKMNLADPWLIACLLGIMFVTGVIAGSYPALFLSSFKPVQVLRKQFLSGKKGGGLRRILVIVQFTFSIIFIIVTVFIFLQFGHMRSANLGFSRENIIYFPLRGDLCDTYYEAKNELLSHPGILYVSTASHIPTFVDRGELEWGTEPEQPNELARIIEAGYDFDKTFDIKLVEGRYYSEDYATDSTSAMIVNESVVHALGYESAIGQDFYLFDDKYIIIGVVEDFVSFPVKLGGDKLFIQFGNTEQFMFIKTAGDKAEILNYIEQVHEKFNPHYPFVYFNIEDYQDPVSENIQPTGMIILYFSIFGIFISCLGLFGLSIFSAEQRIKEVGIRKAMGSSSQKIMFHISKDFLKLIIISFLIGIPLARLLVGLVLRQMSDRVTISAWVFILAATMILVVSVLTISYQAIRSANRNPADSLRYE